MTGWGAHGLDQIQWALGMDDTGPVEIWTEGEKFDPPVFIKPGSRSDGDSASAGTVVSFRYADGTLVTLDGGPIGGGIFIGEKGTITINRDDCKVDPADIASEPPKDPNVQLYVSNSHMGNWFECMRSRKAPAADVEIGHRTATVCHLGNIGRWLGRKLQWDPVKETFPGDEVANALLDRERRPKYDLPREI